MTVIIFRSTCTCNREFYEIRKSTTKHLTKNEKGQLCFLPLHEGIAEKFLDEKEARIISRNFVFSYVVKIKIIRSY